MKPFYSFRRPWALSWLLLLCLSACMFDRGDDNFVQVDPTPHEENTGDILYSFYAGAYYPLVDTLWLTDHEYLYIKFGNGKVKSFEIRIDGISSSYDGSSRPITSDNLAGGPHALEITATVASGTTSLADQSGRETFKHSYHYVLMIGKKNFQPQITSIRQADGTIKISWNRYPYGDFQAYKIRKADGRADLFSPYRELTVTDQNQTTFEDHTDVGGWIGYTLVVDQGGKFLPSGEQLSQFPYQPRMRLSAENNSLQLSWDQAPYYKNIKFMSASRGTEQLAANIDKDKLSIDLGETAPVFGEVADYSLVLYADVEDPGKIPEDKISITTQLTVGAPVPTFKDVVYNEANDVYYFVNFQFYHNDFPDGIYKLDKDLNIIDSTTAYSAYYDDDARLMQSPDGSHLYAVREYLIREIDQSNLTFPTYGGPAGGFRLDGMAASNNNLFVYTTNGSNANVNILDFATGQDVASVPSAGPAHISPDGQYFITGAKLYHANGSSYALKSTLPYTNVRYVHFLAHEQKLLISTDAQVIVYDYAGDTELTRYAYSTGQNEDPGFNEHTLEYTTSKTSFELLNIRDGSIRSVPIRRMYAYPKYYAEGNYLFTSLQTGFALKLH